MRKFNRWTAVAVAAIVALLVGAGSATAGSLITSAKIKNGTIKLEDISASAKAALKGNTGAPGVAGNTGATGNAGATGAQGVQGPAGGFDPAKVTYVEGPTVSVAASSAGNPSAGVSTAKCPAGTKVVGGGYYFGYANAGITVELSSPLQRRFRVAGRIRQRRVGRRRGNCLRRLRSEVSS